MPHHPNQFDLLKQRRFAPFFWTQFLGAANDNLFKFALTMLLTYQLRVTGLPPVQVGLVIGALFILPFLLFSATCGQLADKYEKTILIRGVKWFELAIMVAATYGLVGQHIVLLLGCVFLLGVHSTLFGPVKYAYLPQHLNERELTGGNALVEMGTFVAIMLGQVIGGVLVGVSVVGVHYIGLLCISLAFLGRVAAQFVPESPANAPELRVNWNPVTETWCNLTLAYSKVVVFRSLLGVSWLWFFGSVFLSQFPIFTKDILRGDEQVAALLLLIFSLGIGAGSLLCEVLSRRHVEIGLVPVGAIGMSVFAVDLFYATSHLGQAAHIFGLHEFIAQSVHWRVMTDLVLLALCAGLYSVPMYALIQLRSPVTHRARIMAANNILNALFMIISSVLVGILLANGVTVVQVFLLTGLLNAIVAGYIFMLVPEYLLRFIAFVLTRCIYRFRVYGDEHIPIRGAAILVCNHVSFLDAILLLAASPRPIRFIMDYRIFNTPILGAIFRLGGAIPIAPRREAPEIYERAFAAARQVLEEGDLLCIFPEGAITHDGQLAEFKGGIMKILEPYPVPVVPLALQNMWGSFFSRIHQGKAMTRPFRRGIWSRVNVVAGEALPAAAVTPQVLQARVQGLLEQDLNQLR